jgi:hypothetical protein
MKTRPQDLFWGLLAGVMAFLSAVGLWSLLYSRERIVETLVGVIPASWIVVGCWRRTKWGAPDEGLRASQEQRALAKRE